MRWETTTPKYQLAVTAPTDILVKDPMWGWGERFHEQSGVPSGGTARQTTWGIHRGHPEWTVRPAAAGAPTHSGASSRAPWGQERVFPRAAACVP